MPYRPQKTSEKQFDKYYRQKYIQLLEKIMKNLFRMFRDETTTKEQITSRFFELKEKLDNLWTIHLDSDYHKEMWKYVTTIASLFSSNFTLDDVREQQMSKLNSIQKIKNKNSYKRK